MGIVEVPHGGSSALTGMKKKENSAEEGMWDFESGVGKIFWYNKVCVDVKSIISSVILELIPSQGQFPSLQRLLIGTGHEGQFI